VDGPITPVVAEYRIDGVRQAEEDGHRPPASSGSRPASTEAFTRRLHWWRR
jgi:hypothetical protein